RVAVGFAFTGAIVGEFVGASSGLGYLMNFAQGSQNASLMMATVVVIMAVIAVLFAVLERVERRSRIANGPPVTVPRGSGLSSMARVYCVIAHWTSSPLRLRTGQVNAYKHRSPRAVREKRADGQPARAVSFGGLRRAARPARPLR